MAGQLVLLPLACTSETAALWLSMVPCANSFHGSEAHTNDVFLIRVALFLSETNSCSGVDYHRLDQISEGSNSTQSEECNKHYDTPLGGAVFCVAKVQLRHAN